jgi:hypothetical protein
VPLELVWGPRATQLLDRLRDATSAGRRLGILEAALVDASLKHGAEHLAVPPAVRHALREVASGHRVDWADLALAGGFVDQAHLAHEFHAFSGLSPVRYLTAERPFPNHVRID